MINMRTRIQELQNQWNRNKGKDVVLVLWMDMGDVAPKPEVIINPYLNIQAKVEYIGRVYTPDLVLKANSDIKIDRFAFVEKDAVSHIL